MRVLVPLALLSACRAAPDLGTAFIAPFDGQTALPVDFAPEVSFALDLPPDQAIDPDAITVLDLTAGGPVAGEVELTAREIRFDADDPLPTAHDFAWSVQAPEQQPRGPSVLFPPAAVGTADFSTRTDLEAVAAWRDPALGVPCVLLSRAAGEAEFASVVPTVDARDRDPDWTPVALDDVDVDGDPGVTGLCLARAPVDEGAVLRIAIGTGMWTFTLQDDDPNALLKELRRWSD